MLIVPSVTMNGGRPPQLISAPLARPQAVPAASASVNATGSGCPPWSAVPRTTPASATIDPTERSMPPDRITNVIPTATIALMLVCSTTLTRFETVRKCGVRIHSAAHSSTRPISVPNWRGVQLASPSAALSTRSSVASAAANSA